MAEVFEFIDNKRDSAVIRVIGVGGGGCNTVNQMVQQGIAGVEFISANTDAQHLDRCHSETILQLGANTTRGLGAGANPEVGRAAAEEDKERIREAIEGTDMLFITCGMGGGTGTGGAPVVAEVARELDILTLAVVTKPFPFEGKKRADVAKAGIVDLEQYVDSLIVIPNEKLLTVLGRGTTMETAFKAANDVLQNAVQGISDLITGDGLINVDFADVRRVMSVQGMAMMGRATAIGEDRAREAAECALASPLLEELNLNGAEGILVNITADKSLTINEFQLVNEIVTEVAAEEAEVIVGTAISRDMGDELSVTVVATGLGKTPSGSPVKGLERDASGEVDYETLDKPTIIRRTPRPNVDDSTAIDMDYLDVPAFLRNQAD